MDRILHDPAICGGRPTIRGHRITVATILARLAAGEDTAAICADFPGIHPADVQACLQHAASVADARFIDLVPA